MRFRDMINQNEEMLSGVSASHGGAGCTVSWSYPFKYKRICVFEVPFDVSFNESDAAAGKYKSHILAHPDISLTVNTICNFALFSVDDDDILIRQPKTLIECPINVTYKIIREETVKIIKSGLFKKKKEIEEHKYLEVTSDVDISGSKILYSLSDGIFCLPQDLRANQTISFPMNSDIELFANGNSIKINKTA